MAGTWTPASNKTIAANEESEVTAMALLGCFHSEYFSSISPIKQGMHNGNGASTCGFYPGLHALIFL